MISLADSILFEDDAIVEQLLQRDSSDLNTIDKYGYTPLIEAIIKESLSKVTILLNAGADVNFKDLTNRSPLHWAAEYNQRKIVKKLLDHGADANSFSRDSQPVLVMPMLHGDRAMVNLLCRHGAEIKFAEDFIQTKILGHLFSLRGYVDIVTPKNSIIEMIYEGFYLDIIVPMVRTSLEHYLHHYQGRTVRRYQREMRMMITALRNASMLMRFQDYRIDLKPYRPTIRKQLQSDPLMLPIASQGHGIMVIRHGEWVARCDRGQFGRENGTAIVYRIKSSEWYDPDFYSHLLYDQVPRDYLDNLFLDPNRLQPFCVLPLPPQESGNCTWANISGGVVTTLFLLKLIGEKNPSHNLAPLKQEILALFDEWQRWEKDRALYYYINRFEKMDQARQRCYAAVMTAVFVQQCHYNQEKDLPYVKRMLPIIMRKPFRYIVKAYIETLKTENYPGLIRKIREYCDDFGFLV